MSHPTGPSPICIGECVSYKEHITRHQVYTPVYTPRFCGFRRLSLECVDDFHCKSQWSDVAVRLSTKHRAAALCHIRKFEFLIQNYLYDSSQTVTPIKVQRWTDFCLTVASRDRSRSAVFCVYQRCKSAIISRLWPEVIVPPTFVIDPHAATYLACLEAFWQVAAAGTSVLLIFPEDIPYIEKPSPVSMYASQLPVSLTGDIGTVRYLPVLPTRHPA